MRTKILALVATTLIALSMTVYAAPAQARAVDGCTKDSQTASYRSDFFAKDEVTVPGWGSTNANYKLTAQTYYWLCYDNNGPTRVRPDMVGFCAEKLNDVDPWTATPLRKFVFNPYYFTFDGDTTIDPGSYPLTWDGRGNKGDKVCTGRQGIPEAIQAWLKQGNRPAWTVTGHVDIGNISDRDIEFHDVDTTSRAHLITPSDDPLA